MTPLDQATFIIMPIRGVRTVEDLDMQELVKEIDAGRAVLSVEWVEQCIDEDTLVAIEPYQIILPNEVLKEELHEESFSSPDRHISMPEPQAPSILPPPVEKKPNVSSYFTPAPPPTVMRVRKRRRPSNSGDSTPQENSSVGLARSASSDIEHLPTANAIRQSAVPAFRRKIPQVIDLTVSDDDEEAEGVEHLLPEQTPIPTSPPRQAAPARSVPRWATEDDEDASGQVQARARASESARASRGPTPSVFQLTPSARKRRDESNAL